MLQLETTSSEYEAQRIELLIREVSPATDSFIGEQRYLPEINFNEELDTFSYRRSRCIDLLLNELDQLGIIYSDESELYENDYYCETIIWLRKKFDKDKVYSWLSKCSETLTEKILAILHNGYSDDIVSLINLMYNNYPLDSGWERLFNYQMLLSCNLRWNEHMLACYRKLQNSEPININRDNAILKATTWFLQYRQGVIEWSKILLHYSGEIEANVDANYVLTQVNKFYRELTSMQGVALYVDNFIQWQGQRIVYLQSSEFNPYSRVYLLQGVLHQPLTTFTDTRMILILSRFFTRHIERFNINVRGVSDLLKDYPELINRWEKLVNIIRKYALNS